MVGDQTTGTNAARNEDKDPDGGGTTTPMIQGTTKSAATKSATSLMDGGAYYGSFRCADTVTDITHDLARDMTKRCECETSFSVWLLESCRRGCWRSRGLNPFRMPSRRIPPITPCRSKTNWCVCFASGTALAKNR